MSACCAEFAVADKCLMKKSRLLKETNQLSGKSGLSMKIAVIGIGYVGFKQRHRFSSKKRGRTG